MAVYQSLAYYAASLTTATNMGIILSLMPLMALTAEGRVAYADLHEAWRSVRAAVDTVVKENS